MLIINDDVGYSGIGDNGYGCELYIPVNHCCSTFVKGSYTQLNATIGKIYIVDAQTFIVKDSIDMGEGQISSCASSGKGYIYISDSFQIISHKSLAFVDYKCDGGCPSGGTRLLVTGNGFETINIQDRFIPPDIQYLHVNQMVDSVLAVNDRQHRDYEMAAEPLILL